MTEDAKRFNLIGALQGRTYPKKTVKVWLDEAALYELGERELYVQRNPQDEEALKELEAFQKALADAAWKVTVQGVPRHVLVAIYDAVEKEHPSTRNPLTGELTQSDEAQRLYSQKLWEAHVVSLEVEGNESIVPSPEEIAALRDSLPGGAYLAIETAIQELMSLSNVGHESVAQYEKDVQDLSFLSQR